MAITVRHDVSGRAAGDVAFRTGKGQRRERDLTRRQAAIEEDRRARLREQALEFRKTESEADRERQLVEDEIRQRESEIGRQFLSERDEAGRKQRFGELEFGRETGRLESKEDEARTARELALQLKHMADGDERAYTVEQQRKKDAIASSRAKIEQQLGEGSITWEQADNFNDQLDLLELGISKQFQKKQPTAQDAFNQQMVEGPNGINYLYDPKAQKFYIPANPDLDRKLKVEQAKSKSEQDKRDADTKAESEASTKRQEGILKIMEGGGTDDVDMTLEAAANQYDAIFGGPKTAQEQQIHSHLRNRGMSSEDIAGAVRQEGSYEAVIQIVQAAETARAADEAAKQRVLEITRKKFEEEARRKTIGTGGVDKEFFGLSVGKRF